MLRMSPSLDMRVERLPLLQHAGRRRRRRRRGGKYKAPYGNHEHGHKDAVHCYFSSS